VAKEQQGSRNEKIVQCYVDGCTLQECSARFGISHERVRQILRAAGVFKNFRAKQQQVGLQEGVVVSDNRDKFLGVNLSETDKAALKNEAERRGISMSMLTSDLIKEMLATRS
jgi:hypothetical protein